MMDDVTEKLREIYLVVEDIKKFPQTYNTILKDKCKDGTCQTILRRKLNKLCKEGVICKTSIPGTRFGKAIFYTFPKIYHVLVESSRIGSNVYCYFDFKRHGRYYIRINPYWELKKGRWVKYNKEKTVFEGNVLLLL